VKGDPGDVGPKGDQGIQGLKGDPGQNGHSPVVAFGTTQATADQLTIDGVVTGPHLTGPAGQTPNVVFGSGASADQIIINGSLYSPHLTGPAGTTDHGSQQGLGDDDHSQYYNEARGDARYLKLAGGTLTGPVVAVTAPAGTLSDGGGDAPLEVRAGAVGGHAYVVFHSPGAFAQKFGMDEAGDLYVGSYSRGAAKYKVWRNGDHLARTESLTIAAGATGLFTARSSSAGTGVYILSSWPGYNALFSAAHGSGVLLMAPEGGVVASASLVANKLAVSIDAGYRINVINGLSFAMPTALWSVSRQL
jgi:hypothetical protein